MKLGIAIASGTFKGVFGHGVLSALEEQGVYADAYACASSSVLSGGMAAGRRSREIGVTYWIDVAEQSVKSGMSDVVLSSIEKYSLLIKQALLATEAPRLLIAVSQVVTEDAKQITQGESARKLGRKLLINALRNDNSWVVNNLKKVIFDTENQLEFMLNNDNFDEVAYASTRMLHAWERAAWIGGLPFVDASYTCSCPAMELAELGYKNVIVISSEPGDIYNDIFKSIQIDKNTLAPSTSYLVSPDYDLKNVGVDFMEASEEGMRLAYQHGYDKGLHLINKLNL